jgi:hypothetical protein
LPNQTNELTTENQDNQLQESNEDRATNTPIDVVAVIDTSIDVDTATGLPATSVEGQSKEPRSDGDSFPDVRLCTGMVLRSARGRENGTQKDPPVQQTDSPIIDFVTTHFFLHFAVYILEKSGPSGRYGGGLFEGTIKLD